MPAIGSVHVASAVALWDPANIVLTICSLVCMVTVVSMCTCCARKVKNRDPDDVYGVVNQAAVTVTSGEGPSVQFRNLTSGTKVNERHSQPAGRHGPSVHGSTRVSAPGRALPQVPGDIYTAIDKNRNKDDIRFADEGCNPTYESIDPDIDSIVDPLYSKVDDTRQAKRDRKYDYPIFSGRNRPDGVASTSRQAPEEVLYQSASQIYAGGSEDPYSSITSDSRAAGNTGDGDSSSAYDPGYAKVKPSPIEAKRMERLEKTERELDQLYSKIRRSSRDAQAASPPPGPSSSNHFTTPPRPDVLDETPIDTNSQVDSQSVASREPSYRYITVRENAEVVRERLRQQGHLGPPVREHYYSTIGNEYESVGDGASSTYSHVRPNQPVSSTNPFVGLSVNTTSREYVPPPPTSPIPDRTSTRVDPRSTAVISPTTTATHETSTVLPSTPYRNPFRQDTVERVEPVSGATYAVVSKSRAHSADHQTLGRQPQVTTTFGASPSQSTTQEIRNSDTTLSSVGAWNTPSLGTATSFAGLHRSVSGNGDGERNSSTSFLPQEQSIPAKSAVQGIQEFMQRPTLPYSTTYPETVIGRKVTEEREMVTENRISSVAGSTHLPSDIGSSYLDSAMSSSRDVMNRSYDSEGLTNRECSTERIHHVEIRRVGPELSGGIGPSADDIISGRRYRGNSQSHNLSRDDLRSLNLNQVSQPGPSSPVMHHSLPSSQVASPEDAGGDSSRSRNGSRSGLPVPRNDDEIRKLRERSRQRRQESIEREERQAREAEAAPSSARVSDRSKERRKPWKEETEEEKIQRLGTIYTANDYVSTIDMGRGSSRPWPMTGSSSPPSLRKEMGKGDEEFEDNNNEKSGRELLLPVLPLGSVTFSWELSDSSSSECGADGAGCDDVTCFCHGKSPRNTVVRSNLAEMERLNWGRPIDDQKHG